MPTLNDSRRMVRQVSFGMALALGLIVGSATVAAREPGSERTLVLLLGGSAVEILVCVAMVVVSRRADARIRNDIERCTRELVEGTVAPVAPVPALVVRGRRERQRTGGTIDKAMRPFGLLDRAGRIVVLAVLPVDAAPRRVGVLVPPPVSDALAAKTVHLVHLHPGHPEAGVLNVRAAAGILEAARHDPRWASAALPSERSIAGGILPAIGFGLLGLTVGFLVALAIGFV